MIKTALQIRLLKRLNGLVALWAIWFSAAVIAQDKISIDDAWIRETPPVAKVAAAYMTIQNHSDQVLALVAVESPVALVSEIHVMSMQGDLMQMSKTEQLEIAAKGKAELAPGGYHLMLMQLQEKLPQGKQVPMTLTFSDGSKQQIKVPVRKAN